MTPEEMAGAREDLEAFAAELFDGFFRADQRPWGQAYVRGLLLDGRRKSVEPMAARFGEDGNRQALAHFITSSPWDPAHGRARLAWRMHEAIGAEALIVDDTGFLQGGGRLGVCVAAVHRHPGQGHRMPGRSVAAPEIMPRLR
ncbi:transposase [Streptomyces sp. Root264]|uniref:transposase n=1 Tax=Streptomyces sp. Root264 TaxID=1736503 RepID=UPI0024126919|nr:transposase [Streptomyces sp. Root264]